MRSDLLNLFQTHIPSLVLNLLFVYAIGYGMMYVAEPAAPKTEYVEREPDMSDYGELDNKKELSEVSAYSIPYNQWTIRFRTTSSL